MWGVFLPIYINQPLEQSTPKLPYEEPLVWEIPRVVNYIFLLFPSPSQSSLPCPARPSSSRQQVRPSTMFLPISNVAASSSCFFFSQQNRSTPIPALDRSVYRRSCRLFSPWAMLYARTHATILCAFQQKMHVAYVLRPWAARGLLAPLVSSSIIIFLPPSMHFFMIFSMQTINRDLASC